MAGKPTFTPNMSEGNEMPQCSTQMKVAAAERIKQFYFQLRNGCGNTFCTNSSCASSGKIGHLTNDEAAALALQMISNRAELCLLKTDVESTEKTLSTACLNTSSDKDTNGSNKIFTLENLRGVICDCEARNSYSPLRIYLRKVFSDEEILMESFKLCDSNKTSRGTAANEGMNGSLESLKLRQDAQSKEELRASEYDLDKDVDCAEDTREIFDLDQHVIVVKQRQSLSHKFTPVRTWNVDVSGIREAYQYLSDCCPKAEYSSTLVDTQLQLLKDSLILHWRLAPTTFCTLPGIVHVFILLLENPDVNSEEYVSTLLGQLCFCLSKLCVSQQVTLVNYLLIHWHKTRLLSFMESLRIVMVEKLLQNRLSRDFTINEHEVITATTQVMQLLYYVSMCGGELDCPLLAQLPPPHETTWEPLAKALGVHPLDSRTPLIPLEHFYADFLSDRLEMDRDFAFYKAGNHQHFSFLNYPFILNAATKALGLYYDNRVRMYSQRRISIYQTVVEGQPANPYLTLRIRRDHIIDDALVELELMALDNPSDLKKQLVVEFENEQGIDEGGVSKEFFQLIIEQLFNPDYAMFVVPRDSETFWFNPQCFESDAQFTLIGILLGLAIYNNIILDLHFPSVLYKKLLGKPGSFNDLKDCNKTLYQSLVDLLNYEQDDMEQVFMLTFCIGYEDIFGSPLKHDLIPDANSVPVTQANKLQFVRLYADFLLNGSIERQYKSFEKGFSMVTGDSPLKRLFRTDELELLICGSKKYDFGGLKKSTEYDGGYDITTPIIIWFWDLIDKLNEEDKKKLLQFTTGSARVPVGGLAKLKMVIARNGPDTDRLPTAHTCFNVLLLPEYSTRAKMEQQLVKAIKYAQGFGML